MSHVFIFRASFFTLVCGHVGRFGLLGERESTKGLWVEFKMCLMHLKSSKHFTLFHFISCVKISSPHPCFLGSKIHHITNILFKSEVKLNTVMNTVSVSHVHLQGSVLTFSQAVTALVQLIVVNCSFSHHTSHLPAYIYICTTYIYHECVLEFVFHCMMFPKLCYRNMSQMNHKYNWDQWRFAWVSTLRGLSPEALKATGSPCLHSNVHIHSTGRAAFKWCVISRREFWFGHSNRADKQQNANLALIQDCCCCDEREEKVLLTQIYKHIHHPLLMGSNRAWLVMTEPAVDLSGRSHFFRLHLRTKWAASAVVLRRCCSV